MTRESKAGLLMITMLIGVFGFMVYKKLHQPLEAKAQQEPRANAVAGPDGRGQDSDQTTEAAPEFDVPKRRDAGAKIAVGEARSKASAIAVRGEHRAAREDFNAPKVGFAEPKATPEEDQVDRDEPSDSADNPFEDLPRSTPRLTTQIPDDDHAASRPSAAPKGSVKAEQIKRGNRNAQQTDSDEEVADSKPKRGIQPPRMAAAEPSRDPFGDAVEIAPASQPKLLPATNDENMNTARRDRTDRRNVQASTPEPKRSSAGRWNEDLEFETPRTRPAKQPSQIRLAQAESDSQLHPPNNGADREADPFFNDAPPKRTSEQPKSRDFFDDQPAALDTRGEQPTFSPRTRENSRRAARPAPVARIDEDFASQPTAQSVLAGDTYQIQPNDNFWSISRKKYGTGRYFMALAQHNAQVIPDVQRMKPGVTISTPNPDALERAYSQFIPKAAPTTATGSPVQTASAASFQQEEVDTQGTFFVGRDGTPMYRVGKGDTLGAIAQRHLGRSSRYVQIFKLNQDILTDDRTLSIGMELRLPADASRVEVVGGGGRNYR